MERNDAKAMEVISNAEGIIAPLLKEYNMHEANKKKLAVFDALANNTDVVLTPSSASNDTQTMLLVDQILSQTSKFFCVLTFVPTL